MDVHALPPVSRFAQRREVDGAAATAALGERAAALLTGGEIILLWGPLGAGKTCFAQGLGRGLGIAGEIASPTFTLVNSYRGRLVLHHLDFYRIDEGHDLADIGVPDVLDEVWDGGAVAVVEWPGPLLGVLGAVPRFELLVLPGAGAELFAEGATC
jgi:tRNA threonylcarbamoyladenosine biosynthesis protein TsaE